jgi:hypothetical protein
VILWDSSKYYPLRGNSFYYTRLSKDLVRLTFLTLPTLLIYIRFIYARTHLLISSLRALSILLEGCLAYLNKPLAVVFFILGIYLTLKSNSYI